MEPAPHPAAPAATPEPTSPRGPLTITAIPAGGESPGPIAIAPDASGDYRFSLECLPGADAVHLEIALGGQTRLRVEVRAQAGEQVRCALHLDEGGAPILRAGNHQVLFLPLESAYGAPPPLPVPRAGEPWDICLVIDATTRSAAGTAAPPGLDAFLLDQPDHWRAVVEPVVDLVRQLGQAGPGCRLAVIAFGDEPPPPGVYAPDLQPRLHLCGLPADRPAHLLVALTPDALAALLLTRLSASPGGDFVDALADALAAAAALQWGDARRRLLLVIGDSPGHASAHPVPCGGDALARRHDVDSEALRLHRDQRVEIMTLYHPPPAAFVQTLMAGQAALIQHARDQYRRLAATPGLAFTTADFDPGQAAAALLGRRTPLGRGPCWGRLIED